MDQKNIDYCLLYPINSVEEFLKAQFHCSGNKLKKYFSKSLLNKSCQEKSVLKLPLNFINDGMINPVYEGDPLVVIAEDEHFFVFNKNPNQFIHPLSYDECNNCLSYLRIHHHELLKINEGHYDRGLLYRLDYETSGLVIYVKEEALYKKLREEFRLVAKEKIYHCWVEGEMSLKGHLIHSFSESEAKGKRVIVGERSKFQKIGELSVTPVRYDQNLDRTLVHVALKTGLRHQIRAQLAHVGYPLAGDLFYGGKKANRLYLHAYSYALDVSGRRFSWTSEANDFSGI